MASKNTTFKIIDVEKLMHEAIYTVAQNDWEECMTRRKNSKY